MSREGRVGKDEFVLNLKKESCSRFIIIVNRNKALTPYKHYYTHWKNVLHLLKTIQIIILATLDYQILNL